MSGTKERFWIEQRTQEKKLSFSNSVIPFIASKQSNIQDVKRI